MAWNIERNPTRLHEVNYAKLQILAPGLEVLPPSSAVRPCKGYTLILSITEQCRYTTTLSLVINNPRKLQTWVPYLQFRIRSYHDAEVAEVLSFARHSQFKPKYPYPNEQMFQPDEKRQINRFLSDTLSFCLRSGLSFEASWDPLTI